jgi:hypothetical protein
MNDSSTIITTPRVGIGSHGDGHRRKRGGDEQSKRQERRQKLPDKSLEQKLRKQGARRTGTEGRRTIKAPDLQLPGWGSAHTGKDTGRKRAENTEREDEQSKRQEKRQKIPDKSLEQKRRKQRAPKDEKGLKQHNLQLLQGPAPGEGRNTRTEILKHRGRHVRGTGRGGGGEDTTKIAGKYHGTGAETNSAGEDTTNRKRR